MRRALATLVLLVLLASGTPAESGREVRLRTVPGGATVVDLEGTVVASGSETARWKALPGQEHTYRILHPNYDPMEIRLRWREDGWELADRYGDGRTARLEADPPLAFVKTVLLDVSPPDARVFAVLRDLRGAEAEVAVARALDLSQPTTLSVSGVDYEVAPMRRGQNGEVTVPRAHRPPRLVLQHPFFAPRMVSFAEGELDNPDRLFPSRRVNLSPRFGPFSYRPFQLLTLLAVLAGWLWLERRRRARCRVERDLRAADRLMSEAAAKLPGPDELPSLPGETLSTDRDGSFCILRPLGAGAHGAVFEAVNTDTQERCAVKVLFRRTWLDAEFRARFRQEIEICSRLRHPGLVELRAWGLYREEWPFMVTELVDGRELRRFLGKPVDWRRAVPWTVEVLRALRAAHEHGIIHRDLKPENLMVTRRGHVKVMDFGIARNLDRETLTQTDEVLGTPRYMSPEHLDARTVTPASDLYSLGVILYEMLAGRPPFEAADTHSLLVKMLAGQARPLGEVQPDLPEGLPAIVARMMARREEDRYSSAEELIEVLTGWMQGR